MNYLHAKFHTEVDDSAVTKQDELELTTAHIRFFLKETKIVSVDIDEPHMMSAAQYAEMNQPGDRTLTFCDSNGSVYIRRREEHSDFQFEVSRMGCGGGGSITINIPIHICMPIFEQFANWRRQFEDV